MDKANIMGLVKQALDIDDLISYNSNSVLSTSPYAQLVNTFKDVQKIDAQKQQAIEWLSRKYDVKSASNVSPQALIDKYKGEAVDIIKRYPLLKSISSYSVNKEAVAEYINLIDQSKGV
jgi:ABC-type bacteriocin/lantibiotic exporter with double-glycine peptidase domain